MASDNQLPLSRPHRRGSWARAFERVKDAMKRRRSTTTSTAARPLHTVPNDSRPPQEQQHLTLTTAAHRTIVTPRIPDTREGNAIPDLRPLVSAEPGSSQRHIAESSSIDIDEDDENDDDFSQLPTFSTRTAITDERACDLFAKYNLKYDPRGKRPQQEPSNKIRRVEKPVRLRVHWTCHECRSQFGMDKVCMYCGHRRCRECARHPPKRARPVLELPQVDNEVEPAHIQEAAEESPIGEEPTTADPDLQSYREEPSAPPLLPAEDASPKGTPRTSAVATAGGLLLSQPLEIDDDAEADYTNLRSSQLLTYARPRAAIHTIVNPTSHSTRRVCHQCDTPMLPSGRHNCPQCGHDSCQLCTPREPQAGPSTRELQEHVPMVRAVKRVYRKPRQRVRYRCEHCDTHFVESDRCIECGHERCQTCHREPPKRHARAHDAEVLARVADRLAAYGGGGFGSPSPGIAASAG